MVCIEENIKKIIKNNEKKILKDYKEEMKIFESCVEKQLYIIKNYCLNVDFSYKIEQYPFLKGIVYKNTINLHSALELIKIGYHSSAAILLRNVLEGILIIVQIKKYNDNKLYEKFKQNKIITINYEFQKNSKIPLKVKKEIKLLWQFLCKKTHATTSTMQISLDYENEVNNKRLSNKELTSQILGIYTILLDMNWIMTEKYIFDDICRYIIKEKFKLNGEIKKFNYRHKNADIQSKYYRKKYTSYPKILIDFLEEFNDEIELAPIME